MTLINNFNILNRILKSIFLYQIPNYSVIYIEFQSNLSHQSKRSFVDHLETVFSAIQNSHADHAAIQKQLKTAQQAVSEHPTPLIEFHKEWVDLFDWLQDFNFSFLCIGSNSMKD